MHPYGYSRQSVLLLHEGVTRGKIEEPRVVGDLVSRRCNAELISKWHMSHKRVSFTSRIIYSVLFFWAVHNQWTCLP